MLPAGLKRVGAAVELTGGATVAVYCGIGIDNTGAMVFNGGVPNFFPNGVPCNSTNSGLCAISYATRVLPTIMQSGFMTDATGRAVTVNGATAVAPLQEQNGYTFDANGALLTT